MLRRIQERGSCQENGSSLMDLPTEDPFTRTRTPFSDSSHVSRIEPCLPAFPLPLHVSTLTPVVPPRSRRIITTQEQKRPRGTNLLLGRDVRLLHKSMRRMGNGAALLLGIRNLLRKPLRRRGMVNGSLSSMVPCTRRGDMMAIG